MRRLIPLVITCFMAAGLASCDVTGEESFDFKEGNSLAIVGSSSVALDSTESYYSKAFTINKDYTWTVTEAEGGAEAPAGWLEVYREGEFLDFTPAELGFYTISVEDSEGYTGEITVDVTDFIPAEAASQGYTLLEEVIGQVAEVSDTLQSAGPFTIFAPTNEALLEAYDADNSGALEAGEYPAAADLYYHLLPSSTTSGSFEDGAEFTTMEGSSLELAVSEDGETVTINGTATVVATDSSATNGVIHGIDAVLTP